MKHVLALHGIWFALLFTFSPLSAQSPAPSVGSDKTAKEDDLLAHLIGSWKLTGKMGNTELQQEVTGQWVVQKQFVEMHFVGLSPAPGGRVKPYEAIYFLGYDAKSKQYQLHLFDTFGPSYSRTVGVGIRHGDSIEFVFESPDGKFSNTFVWRPQLSQWDMLLRQQNQSGQWQDFATKTLRR